MVVIVSGRVVATLRAPSAQRPIRKSGRCSGEFFSRKGSSRSQTPLVIPHSEFGVKYLHNSSVRMVWPTVYDGQEVTIINLFYFYPKCSYVSANENLLITHFYSYCLVVCRYAPRFIVNAEFVYSCQKFVRSYWYVGTKKQTTINKQMWIVLFLCSSCLSK